ncbi:amidohydrolase, partial [Arthrobacter crystallopoietes BAB-32]
AEGLTPEEALRSYTEWAAIATGTDADKGTLRTGKLADFAVLSGSPLDAPDIAALEVLATIVGGEFTHNLLDPTYDGGAPASASFPPAAVATSTQPTAPIGADA